jgi:hypothetical protein
MVGEEVKNRTTRQRPPTPLKQRDAMRTVGEVVGERPGPAPQPNESIVDSVQFAEGPRQILSGHVHKIDVNCIAIKVSQCIAHCAG